MLCNKNQLLYKCLKNPGVNDFINKRLFNQNFIVELHIVKPGISKHNLKTSHQK